MNTVSPDLLSELAAVVAAKEEHLQKAEAAKAREVELVNRLRQGGLKWRTVVARWAKATGRILTNEEKKRLAASFRMRSSRATRRCTFRSGADCGASSAPIGWG